MEDHVSRQELANAAIRREVRAYATVLLDGAKQNAARGRRSLPGDMAGVADDPAQVTLVDMAHSFLAVETDSEAVQAMLSITQRSGGGGQAAKEDI